MGLDGPAKWSDIEPKLIPLSYEHESSDASALKLVFALRPEWEKQHGSMDIIKFTDGITNTVRSELMHSQKHLAYRSKATQDLEKVYWLV